MPVYGKFAELYARGGYPQFSARVARFLPALLARFDARPRTILDVACGEGTFAVAMAKKGFRVTGVDRSSEMLRLARQHARQASVGVAFLRRDMRSLTFREEFDLATCWYDSLNYLLRLRDLERTFAGVSRALRTGGLFVFDMNTIHGLAVIWQQFPSNVQQDSPDTFEVHRPSYDRRRGVATLAVTGFVRRGKRWIRMDEIHRERGYSLAQIRRCLRRANLRELAAWGSIWSLTPPRPGDQRVWFVARKR